MNKIFKILGDSYTIRKIETVKKIKYYDILKQNEFIGLLNKNRRFLSFENINFNFSNGTVDEVEFFIKMGSKKEGSFWLTDGNLFVLEYFNDFKLDNGFFTELFLRSDNIDIHVFYYFKDNFNFSKSEITIQTKGNYFKSRLFSGRAIRHLKENGINLNV